MKHINPRPLPAGEETKARGGKGLEESVDPLGADKGRRSLSSPVASLHEDRESSPAPSTSSHQATLHQPLCSAALAGQTGPLRDLKHQGHPDGSEQKGGGQRWKANGQGIGGSGLESPNACQGLGAAQMPTKSSTGTLGFL